MLEMMANAIAATLWAVWELLRTMNWAPWQWGAETWLVVAALVALGLGYALLRRSRKRAEVRRRPKLLVSMGEIRVINEMVNGVRTPRFELALIVSNLNAYSVQLLEVALKTPEMHTPISIEAAHLVPANTSLQLDEPLPEFIGEQGTLNLYFYAAWGEPPYFKLRAPFAWEPWYMRYKVSPRLQSVEPATMLPSEALKTHRVREVREGLDVHGDREPAAPRGNYRFPDEF